MRPFRIFDFGFWIGRSERNKAIGFALCALLLALGFSAEAQQPGKIPWIGYLASTGSGPSSAFIQGLQDLGYVEGKNIAFVFRTAEGHSQRYTDLAAELVRLKVDIIVADNSGQAMAVKKATNTIPIVMTGFVTDPIGIGLVASLARPGGNVTGLTNRKELVFENPEKYRSHGSKQWERSDTRDF